MSGRARGALPGFGLSLGYTVFHLGLLVLLPLSMLFVKTSSGGFDAFWKSVAGPRAVAAFQLSFGTAAVAAAINLVFGFIVAWSLARYKFPGRNLLDAVVDLPFALPTAVAGIALTSLYSQHGILGSRLAAMGIKGAFSPLGIVIALVFTGFPFVVRTVQPVLQEMSRDVEEAAATLGASRGQTFLRIILPGVLPAALTGFTLAFARGLGEYGSVVFISGNMPHKTEVLPLLIMTRLEQFDYAGTTSLAVVMLGASFALLLIVNTLQARMSHRAGAGT